jgi:hypothetical protein
LPSPTRAHVAANYPYDWAYTILNRVFYVEHPASWPGSAWSNRFEDAMAKWNGVSGVGLVFSFAGNDQADDSACGPRDIIDYGYMAQVEPLLRHIGVTES